ncbi:heme oxygenase [Savitreella phatthalungensis]
MARDEKSKKPSSLNDVIASRTRRLHDQNNRLANLRLVGALRSGRLWREYLLRFAVVYTAIEDAFSELLSQPSPTDDDIDQAAWTRSRNAIARLRTPLLLRTNRILKDLAFFYQTDVENARRRVRRCSTEDPVAERYAKRLGHLVGGAGIENVDLGGDRPIRVLAYASVMYLALFAGGRIIKSRMLSERAGFWPRVDGKSREDVLAHGTHTLSFDLAASAGGQVDDVWKSKEFQDVTALKTFYRALYDDVAAEVLTDDDRETVIDEACEIFKLNDKLISSVAQKDMTIAAKAEFVLEVARTLPVPLLILLMVIANAVTYALYRVITAITR